MAGFDSAQAAAAYLARITPGARAAARAYTDSDHWVLILGWAVTVAALWLVLRTGALARLKRRIETGGSRPWLVALGCGALLPALLFGLTLPWLSLAEWARERRFGLSSRSWPQWAIGGLQGLELNVVAAALAACILYLLIRRAPRLWWAWAGALSALAVFGATVVLPALLPPGGPPLPGGPARAEVLRLLAGTGVPVREVYVRPAPPYEADVAPAPGGARVWISQEMAARVPAPLLRAQLGHIIGHYKHGDAFSYALLLSIIALSGFFVADRSFAWTARRLGAHRVNGIADPTGLPVLAAIGATWLLLATPVVNTFVRVINVRADAYALAHTGEPDGLAALLLETQRLRKPDPSPLEEALFYDHPALKRRIEAAMTWKAAHARPTGAVVVARSADRGIAGSANGR